MISFSCNFTREKSQIFVCINGCFYFCFLGSTTRFSTFSSSVTEIIESTTKRAISNHSTSQGQTVRINLTTAQTEIESSATSSSDIESTESNETSVAETIESTRQTAISNISTSVGQTDRTNLTTAQTEIENVSSSSDDMESTELTEIITTNSLITVTTTFKSTPNDGFDPETTTQPFV